MLGQLTSLVTNVIFIIFLTTAADLLLPGSQLKGFVRLVMGLFIIITLLEPIGRLLHSDALLGWMLPGEGYLEQESIMAQSETYENYLSEQTVAQYETRLAQQIKGLMSLVTEIENCEVQVAVQPAQAEGALGEMEHVTLWLTTVSETEQTALGEKVAGLLANYYGLPEEQLDIHWAEGGDGHEAE